MFGGLEIKGGASKSEPKREEAKTETAAPNAAAAAPLSSSAFSFLNAAPTPEKPAPALEVSSGFSFLNAASTPAEQPPAPAPAEPAVSGFSFLQETTPEPTSATTTTEDAPKTTADEATPAAKADELADATASGFSFMAPATSSAAPAAVPDSKPEEAATEDPSPVSSAFDFLSTPVPEPAAAPPTSSLEIPEPTKLAASTSASSGTPEKASSFAPAATAATAAGTSFSPAGAGISFGGATANTSRPKKKKNRAMKVGMGASHATTALPPPVPTVPSPPRSTSITETRPTASNDTADATVPRVDSNTRLDAEEAARRAEEFMNKKLQEQSVGEEEAEKARAVDAAARNSAELKATIKQSTPAETYDDEMVAAAAAAAKEAKAMNLKGGARGIMGGLFRRSSPPTSSSNLMAVGGGGASRQGSFSNASGHGGRPPKPTVGVETTVTKPSSGHSLSSDDGRPPERPVSTSSFSSPPPLPPKPKPAPPKPEPPKPKTPQDILKAMLQAFRHSVETSMGKVTQLRQQRSQLLEERHKALTQERLATQQKDITEQQQTAAAEAEDFELADKLSAVLESCEKEQQECARMLKGIDLAIQELDSQKKSVVDGVLQCFQSIQTQLETFESTEKTKENKSDDSAMKKFASMTKHLAAEHERLQNDLKHLERDEELVAEERKEVESAISEQSGDFEAQCTQAKEKLAVVEDELEELRQQIKAKEAVATQLRNDIAGHEDSILQVRVQFSRQLQRVQKKETTTKDHRHEWDAEKAKFAAEKENHEAEVKAHSEALAAHEKLMASLKEEIALAGVLEKIVQREIAEEAKEPEDNGKQNAGDSDLLNLQAEVVKCEAAVAEAKEVLKAATSTLDALEEEMKALIAKIPELEAAKKAAAAKRDFKTAGKASKEIKDATARVKECQEELTGEAVQRKETAEAELKKLDAELSEKKGVALEKEKESGIATMQKLADRIKHLIETKKEVCGENYEPDKMHGVGAFVLEEQIKSLCLAGKAHGEKYGGWDELIEDVLPAKGASFSNDDTDAPTEANAKSQDNEAEAKELESPKISKKEMKAKFRRLSQELQQIETKIESAVEEEDFDLAAELDEKLQVLMAEVTALDLTDEEMEQALTEDGDEYAAPSSSTSDLVNEGATSEFKEVKDDAVQGEIAQDDETEEKAMDEAQKALQKAEEVETSNEAPPEAETEASTEAEPSIETEMQKPSDPAESEEMTTPSPKDDVDSQQESNLQKGGMPSEDLDVVSPNASADEAISLEETPAVTPDPSTEDNELTKSNEEVVDEKKDGAEGTTDDGFVAVQDDDL